MFTLQCSLPFDSSLSKVLPYLFRAQCICSEFAISAFLCRNLLPEHSCVLFITLLHSISQDSWNARGNGVMSGQFPSLAKEGYPASDSDRCLCWPLVDTLSRTSLCLSICAFTSVCYTSKNPFQRSTHSTVIDFKVINTL